MKSTQSSEDYLEAILVLSQKLSEVHAVDVAGHLGLTKASVSVAMKKLRENECVYYSENGALLLTKTGREIADRVYEKHIFFKANLMKLGIEEDKAEEEACQIEHVISEESFQALKKYIK